MNEDDALRTLAQRCGVQTSYEDVDGRRQEADVEVLVALVRALGVPLDSVSQARALTAELQASAARRHLEPVVVHWVGRPGTVEVTLPATAEPDEVWLSLELEDGTAVGPASLSQAATRDPGARPNPVTGLVAWPLALESVAGRPIPAGRHRLTLEGAGPPETALVLAAPACPTGARRLGAFMPVHAIRSQGDWGIGRYPDLERLGAWATSCGVGLLGTLPLYPAFLDPGRADPSPYLPVSRLAYNEVFIDPVVLPEFDACPEARASWYSADLCARRNALHTAELVPYEDVLRVIGDALEPMSRCAWDGRLPDRRDGLAVFARAHPELEAYARFRAFGPSGWREGDPGDPAVVYHLYCQWAAQEQLAAATRTCPSFADFPIGSHPDGFDPQWSPQSFVAGAHGGAPPDRFFTGGQDWGFRPLHPQRIREDEYRFLGAALARACRHASCVRIDHVMGLQRLFMIPEGAPGGAYVTYEVDELHALVALEAARAGTVVVGEDLGTVPPEVRPRLARDGMLRTWVFEFESTEECPLPAPPALSVAALDTHDLPRFAAYLWGDELEAPDGPDPTVTGRQVWRDRLLRALEIPEGTDTAAATAAAVEGCLTHLAQSDAVLALVDLEDLWGERARQNLPGTGPGAGNWRRRSARTLEALSSGDPAGGVLRKLAEARGTCT